MMINPKELVEKILAKHAYEMSLTKEEKISNLLEEMYFLIKMYHKHGKDKWDKKRLNSNLWTLIDRIEHVKRRRVE